MRHELIVIAAIAAIAATSCAKKGEAHPEPPPPSESQWEHVVNDPNSYHLWRSTPDKYGVSCYMGNGRLSCIKVESK